jgi:signal transduction histidine kinase
MSTAEAERFDERFEAFAALAAHQLGEAVALLGGATTVLLAQPELLGPAAADAIRGVRAGTERARRFVDDLLDLSMVARDEPRVAEVDMAAALQDARDELAEPLQSAGAQVRAGELAAIRMDGRHARRLLVHLLRVALASGAREIRVSSVAEPGAAIVEIADDGEPPAPGTDEHAFEPGIRVRGRGPLVGAGVSLAIARRIAEAHGGTAALTRPSFTATAVTVTLPAGA